MKRFDSVDDFALFGAVPAFAEPLHVGRPNVGNRERLLERFGEILDRRWFTNDGPVVREFEGRLAEALGVKHCIALCNATVALEIVTRALDLHGEVIVPAYTFVATAHSLQWQQIRPVFVDVDPVTHTIDPARIEAKISPATTGIIGVHLWGQPCDIDGLQMVADQFGLRLLFDAAHAFGCTYRGTMIGSFGAAEVFSFHATKFLNSFEGGAIATNDDALAGKIRLMMNFGFSGYDNVVYIGMNGKMTEVCAAMGIVSLDAADEFVEINRRNHALYSRVLADIPGLRVMPYPEREKSNYQYVVVAVDEMVTGIDRDSLVRLLWAENVLARRYFAPGCHRMEPYRSLYPDAGRDLPVTEALCSSVMTLPTGTAVSNNHIQAVGAICQAAVEWAGELRGAPALRT